MHGDRNATGILPSSAYCRPASLLGGRRSAPRSRRATDLRRRGSEHVASVTGFVVVQAVPDFAGRWDAAVKCRIVVVRANANGDLGRKYRHALGVDNP
jgi:hypothetical protein